jgi:hypothetical protein
MGLAVAMVIVADDVALGANRTRARGIAGTAFVCLFSRPLPPPCCNGPWAMGQPRLERLSANRRCTKWRATRPHRGAHWRMLLGQPRRPQTRSSRSVRGPRMGLDWVVGVGL